MTLAHELPATGWCTFRLQTQWYALPVQRVREVLRPAALTPLPGAPPAVAGITRPDEVIRWLAVAGIGLTAINMIGGFAVTQRMLAMFRK